MDETHPQMKIVCRSLTGSTSIFNTLRPQSFSTTSMTYQHYHSISLSHYRHIPQVYLPGFYSRASVCSRRHPEIERQLPMGETSIYTFWPPPQGWGYHCGDSHYARFSKRRLSNNGLTPLPGGGGLTIVEIAIMRDFQKDNFCILQQWYDFEFETGESFHCWDIRFSFQTIFRHLAISAMVRPPSPGGLTIAEIAKCRKIVWNEKRIPHQWKNPSSQIPILKAWTMDTFWVEL